MQKTQGSRSVSVQGNLLRSDLIQVMLLYLSIKRVNLASQLTILLD